MPRPRAVTGIPADLSSTGKQRWRQAKDAIEGRQGWCDEYHPTLDFYIRSLEAADAAWEQLTSGEDGKPIFTVLDSKDEPKTNPVWRAWREAKASANVAAGELGLTPKARAALGDGTMKSEGGKFAGRFS